jgi:tetratricopeptide (TPR) repeat protein
MGLLQTGTHRRGAAVIQEHLGEVYLKIQRLEEAKAAWLKALALDPKNDELRARFNDAGFGTPPDVVPQLPPESKPQEAAAIPPATEL